MIMRIKYSDYRSMIWSDPDREKRTATRGDGPLMTFLKGSQLSTDDP